MRSLCFDQIVGWTKASCLAVALIAGSAIAANGQAANAENQVAGLTPGKASAPKVAGPAMKEFRSVAIGMSDDDVRSVWGKPKVGDETGYVFELSDDETAQISIGPDKKVTAISVTFEDGRGAPSLTDVFGEDVSVDPADGGKIYKLVRYPQAGYWVAYYAGPGEHPTVTLTFQKL
jgi:hypothetical protein